VSTSRRFFLQFSCVLMFLNIETDSIILKTYEQQFTLTTKKSLHITFNSNTFILKLYTVCHNYQNLQLSGAKFSQYVVYLHKNFRAKAWDNAVWSSTRIVHRTSLLTWRHCELEQHVIDTAVRQWHTRLHACVKAKGGHFEHKLSQ